jgi:hypothetical protein
MTPLASAPTGFGPTDSNSECDVSRHRRQPHLRFAGSTGVIRGFTSRSWANGMTGGPGGPVARIGAVGAASALDQLSAEGRITLAKEPKRLGQLSGGRADDRSLRHRQDSHHVE